MTLDKDYAGILISSLCILHCLSGPVILALGFSSVGFSFLSNEKMHLALVFPIIVLAIWSISTAYIIHKKPLPFIAATLGIILLLTGLMIENLEVILTFSASSLLIFAHFYNRKQLKSVSLGNPR